MLLMGFYSKHLNTLYVEKNLRHHSLIQAFSRTNRILNATKPYGHILDFRQQQKSVDEAIALFSGVHPDRTREIWLVDKAPVVIDKFEKAIAELGKFMQSQDLEAKPDRVNNLKGDDARVQFHQAPQGGPAPADRTRPVLNGVMIGLLLQALAPTFRRPARWSDLPRELLI